ncbi:MAG: hypothetical protein ACFFE4_07515, partial [Candidatus Thorarchaeota archaeon]
RMVRSVRAKCIGIRNQIDNYNELKLIESLRKGFQKALEIQLEEGIITHEEKVLAENLVREKYSNKKWLEKYE